MHICTLHPPVQTYTQAKHLHYKTNKDNCRCPSAPPPLLHTPPLTLPHSWGCGRGSPCQPCAAPLPSPSPAFAPGPPSGTPAGPGATPRPTSRDRDTEWEGDEDGEGRSGRRQDGLVPLLGKGVLKEGLQRCEGPPVVCWQRPVPNAKEAVVQLRLRRL